MTDNYLYQFMFMRFLFLLSLVLVLLTVSLSSQQPLCREDERSALLQFKDGFIIDCSASFDPFAYPKVASWTPEKEHSECCLWDGVECNEDTGHVIRLDLSSSCLYGSINSNTSLFHLLQLQRLNLAFNNFNHSQIPFGVGHLSTLTYLNLSNSMFWGQVPKSLANLSSLATLDLLKCWLHGEFPTEIFLLPSLRFLRVAYNQDLIGHLPEFYSSSSLQVLTLAGTSFYGKLPTSIGNLSSLHVLNFRNCHFSGSIPASLSNFTQLTYLDLSGNTLKGHIPSLSANLTQLTFVDLSYNKLSGMLELDMFLKIKSLSVLVLSSNYLTLLTRISSNDTLPQFHTLTLGSCNLQEFPDFLRNQNKLSWLELPDNNFQGLIPKWLYNTSIETLRAIILSSNFLIGFEQSPIVLPWSKLEVLSLDVNMLQGVLPIPPPSTKIYQVGWNKVSEISPLICNLSSLSELDLSHNNLRGILHPCLGNFSPFLSVLELRSNNFHGTIPKTWANSSSLRVIDLSQNQLEGPLPRSLANSAMLEYLHVGNNKIIGTFPFWLGTLPQLKVLVLHSNGFYGAIRSSESNYTFPKLRIIDLSCNNFSGHLPAEYFLHWTAMKAADANQLKYMIARTTGDWWYSDFAYSIAIANKGIEIEYQKIQDVFTVIDFSSNRFEGEIPYLLGSLKGLHLLNLSNNAFTGHIPSSLGNLRQLESMDLSRNKLSGIIPPQLAELNFLSSFNVSNNRLTGPIPHGEQFDAFENSSFSGNLGLYGKPLSKQCDTLPPSTSEENQGSESSLGFDWKVVVMGYGCGLVVGAVIGKFVTIRKFMRTFVKRQQTPRRVNRRM